MTTNTDLSFDGAISALSGVSSEAPDAPEMEREERRDARSSSSRSATVWAASSTAMSFPLASFDGTTYSTPRGLPNSSPGTPFHTSSNCAPFTSRCSASRGGQTG